MAVKLEHSVRRYLGLSTDTKPTVGTYLDGVEIEARHLSPGSSFLETDTGRIYRWNGEEWTHPSTATSAVAGSDPSTDDPYSPLLLELQNQTALLEVLVRLLAE